MKAIISNLWDTSIEIVTTKADANEIQSLANLRGCDNVLIGDKVEGTPAYEIMVDDTIYIVAFRTVSHPSGCGKLRICELS